MTKLFKHYKPLEEQIKVYRNKHSGQWKVTSNMLGKKEHAQGQLNKIISSLKLKKLLINRIDEVVNMYPSTEVWSKDELLEELQTLIDRCGEPS